MTANSVFYGLSDSSKLNQDFLIMRTPNILAGLLTTVLFIGATGPAHANANAVHELGKIPAKTDWAFAMTDYPDMIRDLHPVYERLASTVPHMPSFDDAAALLTEQLGINPLDSKALTQVGFDVRKGFVIHAAVNPRLKGKQAVTISIGASDAAGLSGWLGESMTRLFRAEKHGQKRVGRTTVAFYGPSDMPEIGIAAQGDWVHLFSGTGKKTILSEAKRVLKSRRTLRQTKAYSLLLEIGPEAQVASLVNFTPITKASIRRLKESIKRARTGSHIPPDYREEHIEWLKEEVRSQKEMLRLKYLAGQINIRSGEISGSGLLTLDNKTLRRYRKAMARATGHDFDVDRMQATSNGFATLNVLPASVLSLFRHDRVMDREWKGLLRQIKESALSLDLEKDVLPYLTGPTMVVIHDFADTPNVVLDDLPAGQQANPPQYNDPSDFLVPRARLAILTRVTDMAPFEKALKGLYGLIRLGKMLNEKQDVKAKMSTVDGVQYLTITFPRDGTLTPFHLGVGRGTVLIGMGQDLPSVAAPWFAHSDKQSAMLAQGHIDVKRLIQSIDRLLSGQSETMAQSRQEWEIMKSGLGVLFAGDVSTSVSESSNGYRMTVRLAIPQ